MSDETPPSNAGPAPVIAEVVDLPAGRQARVRPAQPASSSADPRTPWLSYVLLGAYVLVWLVMLGFGVDPMSPSAEALLDWGGNLGLLTMHGQWWRLLTAMFLHAGLIHLAFNGYFLWVIGRVTELVFGPLAYGLIYFGSGLIASMVSLYWQPDVVSVGASGALFGVFGGFLGITLQRRDRLPPEFVKNVRRNAVILIGINLAIGLSVPNIDLAAHLGGLAGGFGIGWLLARLVARPGRTPAEHRRKRTRAVVLVTLGTGALLVLGAVLLPRHDDVFGTLDRVQVLEEQALSRYEESSELSREARAEVLEREVIPAMREAETALTELERVPERMRERIETLEQYAKQRREAFELELRALRGEADATLDQALRLHDQAGALLDAAAE